MTKEQLRQQFEAETGCASWINADIYPNGRIDTREYTEWLENRLTSHTEHVSDMTDDEARAELMSIRQSILESPLKKHFPSKDISFHDKVMFAIHSATSQPDLMEVCEHPNAYNSRVRCLVCDDCGQVVEIID